MPMPTPKKGEKKKDFVARCMGDAVMVSDYTDAAQRRAVCESQWDDAHGLERAAAAAFDALVSSPRGAVRFTLDPASNLDTGEFMGVASVFGQMVDTFPPTRILRGAFTQTIQQDAARLRLLWQHNADWPVGIPLELQERADGLYLHGKISQTQMGKDALTLMKDFQAAGKPMDLSIGFDPQTWAMVTEQQDGEPVRHISQLKLWEISLVTWGADPQAEVLSVQSLAAAFRELHEGKVLSAKNRRLVQDAIEALQALADAADVAAKKKDTTPGDEPDVDGKHETEGAARTPEHGSPANGQAEHDRQRVEIELALLDFA